MLMTDGELTMPDMTGWTKEDVLAFEDLTKIKVSTVMVCHESKYLKRSNH